VAEDALNQVDVPVTALSPRTIAPSEIQHWGHRERRKLRDINCVIPSDSTMNKLYQDMNKTYGTECKEFDLGAYVCDPIKLIKHLTKDSPFLAVGGDCGGGIIKFGFSYQNEDKTLEFCPIYLIYGKENLDTFLQLRGDYYPFIGESEKYKDIYSILQYFIDNNKAFLNGDWKFLNMILGIQSPNCTYPCPICIVSIDNFNSITNYPARLSTDKHSRIENHIPLLTIATDRIVPLPLHLYLGIGNRILDKVFKTSTIINQSSLEQCISSIKTTHKRGCGGLSDIHELNGNELNNIIKKPILNNLIQSSIYSSGISTRNQQVSTTTEVHHLTTSLEWMKELKNILLNKDEFEEKEINKFTKTINEIITQWSTITNDNPFPKIHMLKHASEFLQENKFLGLVNESAIESCHAICNTYYYDHHSNCGNNTNTRLLRTLESIIHIVSRPLAHKMTN
jgi:hypothetical protein